MSSRQALKMMEWTNTGNPSWSTGLHGSPCAPAKNLSFGPVSLGYNQISGENQGWDIFFVLWIFWKIWNMAKV